MQSTTTAHHRHYSHRHRHDHGIFNDPNPNHSPNSDRPKPNPKLVSLLLKSIIMLLITSLFFIFLSIATLIVIHFFLAGGHAFRRRRRSTTAATSYTTADVERFLPMVQYDGVVDGKEDCAVCLELFKEGEWCRALPACGHVFHASCVDRWLIRRENCPLCRARVRLDLGPSGLAMGDDDCKFFWAVGI